MSDLERVAANERVRQLAEQLVAAMHLPVYPASIEIHFSPDGQMQKVEANVVPWRRAGKQ